jgi:hypothetical protein
MKLIYHDDSKPLSYEEVYKDCQRGYGIKEPDKVSGFMGFFYRLPDIYAYGKVENWIDNNPKIEPELKRFIDRFYAEDYGFVTREEHDNNVESRWLCGDYSRTIGRYAFDGNEVSNGYGGVVLEFFENYGLFYSIDEDMREIYAKEYKNPYYKQHLEYHSYAELKPINYPDARS